MEHVVAPFTNVPGAVWTSAMGPVEVRRAPRSRWCQAECSRRWLGLDGQLVRGIHPRLVFEDILLSKASRMIDAEAHGEVRPRLLYAYVL